MADVEPSGPAPQLESDDVVTVATLNQTIADVVADAPSLHHDWVVGDVADCSAAGGHLYFDLVDGDGDATINCVAFGFQRARLTTEPEDTMRVAVRGELEYYSPRGQCSIQVEDVVELGQGAYADTYEEHRQTLAEEGLLAAEGKQSLPARPETIGLVTSADSDARTDAVTAIHDRYPGVDIVVQDATVQGADALPSLLDAITTLDETPDIDVIVVTRGGGADQTLRVFNEPALCRVIAETATPTAVGIGHEDDHTLAGEVADERVMTPTDAGTVVPDRETLKADYAALETRLDAAYESAVDATLSTYRTNLQAAYQQRVTGELGELKQRLDRAAERQAEMTLADLETRLTNAYQTAQREHQHSQEVSVIRQRYRAIVAVLLTLIGLLIIAVLVGAV